MGSLGHFPTDLAISQILQLSVLITTVALLGRLPLRKRPHVMCVLWIVVLLKCLVPPLWSSTCGIFSRSLAVTLVHNKTPTIDFANTQQRAHLDVTDGGTSNEIAFDERAPVMTPDDVLRMETQYTRNQSFDSNSVSVVGPQHLAWHRVLSIVTSPRFVVTGAALWFAGSCIYAILVAFRLHRVIRRARNQRLQRVALDQYLERLRRRLGLRRRVQLLHTAAPIGPAVIGLWRPTIIFPTAISDTLTRNRIQSLLAHELIHVRRGDLWIGCLQTLAQFIWWFHPLVWLATRRTSRTIEQCCDEQVIAELGCNPAHYAESLVDVLALKQSLRAIPLFPGVRSVDITSERLELAMKLGNGCHKRTPWWCWLVLLAAGAIVLPGGPLVYAEPPELPLQEKVSAPSETSQQVLEQQSGPSLQVESKPAVPDTSIPDELSTELPDEIVHLTLYDCVARGLMAHPSLKLRIVEDSSNAELSKILEIAGVEGMDPAEVRAAIDFRVVEVAKAYWELRFYYQAVSAVKQARDETLVIWKDISWKNSQSSSPSGKLATDLARATEQYFFFRARVAEYTSDLYKANHRVQQLLGDTRRVLIRPADSPSYGPYDVESDDLLQLTLARNVPLGLIRSARAQHELKLQEVRDRLASSRAAVTDEAFRRDAAEARNRELTIARTNARLSSTQDEIANELTDALHEHKLAWHTVEESTNRCVHAEREVTALKQALAAETITLDLLLDSLRRQSEADTVFAHAEGELQVARLQLDKLSTRLDAQFGIRVVR